MSIKSNGKTGTMKSPNQLAIKRFLKNKPAIFGIFVIAIAIFVAIFGYVLAPDSTPDANDQIAEIANKNVGFKIKFLSVRKNQPMQQVGLFNKLLNGIPNPYRLIPINYLKFKNGTVVVEVYNGEKMKGKVRY